ncbi:DUF6879 family protein [Dactylosporangium sp. CA-092794]|uniref:DUF6879 family protein n=1 Tax=Dactylosporangium sp. CA-092794 TaxID=3239929 RepID=UPI003D928084
MAPDHPDRRQARHPGRLMTPPGWALTRSRRLDLDVFAAEFAAAWSSMRSRFLKLECWQRYVEAETNASQAAFDRGDVVEAERLLHGEAEADRPLYEDVQERGIEYARVRLVQEPLTDYLRYELLAYRIRAAMGEHIEVVRREAAGAFDCLLFDRQTALIHDYGSGPVGRQTGGWITHEPATLARLEAMIADFRSRAVPLQTFLAQR